MAPACALMQAPSMAVSVEGTPASTKGVASAVAQVVQAFATFEHGVTAAAKLCVAVMLHTSGGGGAGGDGDGGGGDGLGQLLSADSEAPLTPAATMAPACALMQAPSMAVSVEGTPASTKGVASAVTQVVQALATSAQGVTAAAKLCVAVMLHTSGGGGAGGAGDSGGEAAGGGTSGGGVAVAGGGDDAAGGGVEAGGGGECCKGGGGLRQLAKSWAVSKVIGWKALS
jgi:preprotein translocase subunit SecG